MAKHSVNEIGAIDHSLPGNLVDLSVSSPDAAEAAALAWARDLMGERWSPMAIAVAVRELGMDVQWQIEQIKRVVEHGNTRPATRLKALAIFGMLVDRGLQDRAVDGRRASVAPGEVGIAKKRSSRMSDEERQLSTDGADYVAEVNAVDTG